VIDVRWITWVAVLAPLPYSLSRLAWAVGLPVGINQEGLDAVGVPSWHASPYVLGLALASETVGLLTHYSLLRGHRAFPRFLPVVGGRRVSPRAVIVPAALVSLFVLSIAVAAESPLTQFTDPEAFRRSFPGWMPAWAFWMQQAVLWTWGLSLAVATVVFWRRTGRSRLAL
jgi:hypothetical protein